MATRRDSGEPSRPAPVADEAALARRWRTRRRLHVLAAPPLPADHPVSVAAARIRREVERLEASDLPAGDRLATLEELLDELGMTSGMAVSWRERAERHERSALAAPAEIVEAGRSSRSQGQRAHRGAERKDRHER